MLFVALSTPFVLVFSVALASVAPSEAPSSCSYAMRGHFHVIALMRMFSTRGALARFSLMGFSLFEGTLSSFSFGNLISIL
jgi:hypothetical protein